MKSSECLNPLIKEVGREKRQRCNQGLGVSANLSDFYRPLSLTMPLAGNKLELGVDPERAGKSKKGAHKRSRKKRRGKERGPKWDCWRLVKCIPPKTQPHTKKKNPEKGGSTHLHRGRDNSEFGPICSRKKTGSWGFPTRGADSHLISLEMGTQTFVGNLEENLSTS